MKRATIALIAAASVAAAIWWWFGARGADPEPGRTKAAVAAAASRAAPPKRLPLVRHDAARLVEADSSGQAEVPDVRAQFRASNDYWEFAERVHEAAKRGDGAAQYYLSIALERCDLLYGFFFIEHRADASLRIRTLDEAQQITATTGGSLFTPDDVRDIQSRCQQIMNTKLAPFGDSYVWMRAAQASGYPLAQVRAAEGMAMRSTDFPESEKSRALQSEARQLVFDALRSKDPEVLWELSSTAAFLSGDANEVDKRQWAWRMAACLREAHCDSMTEWKGLLCDFDSQCHRDDTVMDVIRRSAGNDFNEIERRARELNEKIDAGTLDESDI